MPTSRSLWPFTEIDNLICTEQASDGQNNVIIKVKDKSELGSHIVIVDVNMNMNLTPEQVPGQGKGSLAWGFFAAHLKAKRKIKGGPLTPLPKGKSIKCLESKRQKRTLSICVLSLIR